VRAADPVVRYRTILTSFGGIIVMAAIIAIAIFGWRAQTSSYPPVVKAVFRQNLPARNGLADSSVWMGTPATSVKTIGGPTIKVQSFYTKDSVYIHAEYADSSPQRSYQPWVFDGKSWKKDGYGDMLALVFDIDDSIVGYPEKGPVVFSTVPATGPLAKLLAGTPWWPYYLQADKNDKSTWGQRADIWTLGLFYDDIAFDWIMQASLVADSQTAAYAGLVSLRSDGAAPTGGGSAWQSFATTAPSQVGPLFRYKPGFNINNDPVPAFDHMEPIGPGAVFAKGDRLPSFFGASSAGQEVSGKNIHGRMVWASGKWTVDITRLLATNQKDDILFKPSTDTTIRYYFGAAVRAEGNILKPSGPIVLEFEPREAGP
jgi:hypothetical protein